MALPLDEWPPSDKRNLYSGLIRLHVLHHACKEPIFGLGMIEELGRHGYKTSVGVLYPMLHNLARKGYLRQRKCWMANHSVRSTARLLEAGKPGLPRVRKFANCSGKSYKGDSRCVEIIPPAQCVRCQADHTTTPCEYTRFCGMICRERTSS